MDIMTIFMAVVFAFIFLAFLFICMSDKAKKNNIISSIGQESRDTIDALTKELDSLKTAMREQERMFDDKYSRDIEKLKEESESFKKESFEARLEAQNLGKELVSQKTEFRVLSVEYQALKEHQAALEGSKRQAAEEIQSQSDDFQKIKKELEEKYQRALAESDRIRREYEEFRNNSVIEKESLGKKYQEVGFHKVAFEQLSKEDELLRRQLLDMQELHKTDQAVVEELKKKLELANNTLDAQEEVQKDTERLEELLEKQLAVQKKRAVEIYELEQENKALKEHIAILRNDSSGDSMKTS